jgi:hypothetical protein
MAAMATVSTTYFFISDLRSIDRSVAPAWSRLKETSSLAQAWRWAPAQVR